MDKREDSSDIRHFDVEMKVQECPVLIRKGKIFYWKQNPLKLPSTCVFDSRYTSLHSGDLLPRYCRCYFVVVVVESSIMSADFQLLFPESNIMSGDFTIVSLCQQTENDMSGWSEKVESEREALLALYSEAAKELCSALTNAGFWADFLDVCSGKPVSDRHVRTHPFLCRINLLGLQSVVC